MMNITVNLKKEKLAVSHVKLNPTLHLSLKINIPPLGPLKFRTLHISHSNLKPSWLEDSCRGEHKRCTKTW